MNRREAKEGAFAPHPETEKTEMTEKIEMIGMIAEMTAEMTIDGIRETSRVSVEWLGRLATINPVHVWGLNVMYVQINYYVFCIFKINTNINIHHLVLLYGALSYGYGYVQPYICNLICNWLNISATCMATFCRLVKYPAVHVHI